LQASILNVDEIDWTSFSKLVLELQSFSFPTHRLISKTDYQKNLEKVLEKIKISAKMNPNLILLGLQNGDKKKLIGYLILLLGDINPLLQIQQAYIADLGIHPQYWGKFLWRPLLEKACELSRKAGFYFLGAHVTKENQRSYKIAKRFLHFQSIGYQSVFILEKEETAPDDVKIFKSIEELPQEEMEFFFKFLQENFILRADLCGFSNFTAFASHWKKSFERVSRLFKNQNLYLLHYRQNEQRCHLLLRLDVFEGTTGEPQGEIIELPLEKKTWESGISKKLLKTARWLCKKSGLNYLVAHLPHSHDSFIQEEGAVLERDEMLKILL
jgi:ribosomal protein S18 acetylase RimI-like enzyme